MISRAASGTHVCWRCQLHLSKLASANSLFPPLTRNPQGIRLQHNDAWSESDNGSDTLLQKPRDSRSDGVRILRSPTDSRPSPGLKGTATWRPLQKKGVTEHPLGRLHGFRGHRLREKTAELDVKSLGEPAEVIVLRDAGFHSRPRPEIEELKAAEKVDILTRLDAERGLITQTDVEKNLEELRPKTKTIGWHEFQQIQHQLVTGFTESQLIKYSNSTRLHQKDEEKRNDAEHQDASIRAVVRKKNWVPGISVTSDGFDDSALRGYRSEAFTRKQRLALLLLRQCWQIEAQEVVESVGEVELQIGGTELELLIEGPDPLLGGISNKLMAYQDEKIEAFRSRGVVRITATKEKSEKIVQEIQDLLQGFHCLTIELNALGSELKGSRSDVQKPNEAAYGDSVINRLAQLTETHITRLSKNQLEISCIETKPDMNLSTRADVARRLLLTSSDVANPVKMLQSYKDTSEPLVAARFHLTDGMSWRDQLRNWVRWTSATSKSSGSMREPNDAGAQQAKETPGILDEVESEECVPPSSVTLPIPTGLSQEEINHAKPQNTSAKPSGYVYWGRKHFTATSAIVGHVLHEVPGTPEVVPRLLQDTTGQRTMFCSTGMNISRLLSTMPLLDTLPTTSLIMRFTPSPWTAHGPELLANIPPVEMRFTVDSATKELTLKDVIAVVDWTASDVLLPDRVLDLRFQQRTTARLRRLHHHQLSQISQFLKASQLDMTRGRMKTPSKLTLPIATYLCNAQVPEATHHSPDESIDVEYIFGGLEYRSTLAIDFKGWQLLYTSVEGGMADGRRGELRLRPQRVTDNISDHKKNPAVWTEEFIEAAYRLVDTLEGYEVATVVLSDNFTPGYDPKEPSGLPTEPNFRSKLAFRYFRQKIDFMINANEE